MKEKKPSTRGSGRVVVPKASKKASREEDFGVQPLKKKSTKKGEKIQPVGGSGFVDRFGF